MDWKKFLKPDWKKILIFLLIIFIATIAFRPSFVGDIYTETYYFLYSITHEQMRCDTLWAPHDCVMHFSFSINYLNLAFNLISLYLISCLIIFGYNKYKK